MDREERVAILGAEAATVHEPEHRGRRSGPLSRDEHRPGRRVALHPHSQVAKPLAPPVGQIVATGQPASANIAGRGKGRGAAQFGRVSAGHHENPRTS